MRYVCYGFEAVWWKMVWAFTHMAMITDPPPYLGPTYRLHWGRLGSSLLPHNNNSLWSLSPPTWAVTTFFSWSISLNPAEHRRRGRLLQCTWVRRKWKNPKAMISVCCLWPLGLIYASLARVPLPLLLFTVLWYSLTSWRSHGIVCSLAEWKLCLEISAAQDLCCLIQRGKHRQSVQKEAFSLDSQE
jgi:hypothetical protein